MCNFLRHEKKPLCQTAFFLLNLIMARILIIRTQVIIDFKYTIKNTYKYIKLLKNKPIG